VLYCPVTCGWPPLLERVQSLPVNRVSRLLVLELVSLPNRCSGRALAGMFARQRCLQVAAADEPVLIVCTVYGEKRPAA